MLIRVLDVVEVLFHPDKLGFSGILEVGLGLDPLAMDVFDVD